MSTVKMLHHPDWTVCWTLQINDFPTSVFFLLYLFPKFKKRTLELIKLNMGLLTVTWFWPGLHGQEVGQLDKIKVRSQICADFWDLYFNTGFGWTFCMLIWVIPVLCILRTQTDRHRHTDRQTQTHTHRHRHRFHDSRNQLRDAYSKRLWEKEIWELLW